MSTGRRILVHGLMAAVPLAVVGLMLGTLAGMFLESHAPGRVGPGAGDLPSRPAADPGAAASLMWRVPAALAVVGFLAVAAAEGLLSLWRTPVVTPPKPDPNVLAEEIIQAVLRETEERERARLAADARGSESHNVI